MPELRQDGGHVIAHVDRAYRSVSEHRAAVTVKIDGDHLTVRRQCREYWTEHVDRAETAVQEEERLPLAVNLVVVVDALRVDVAGADGGTTGGVSLLLLR